MSSLFGSGTMALLRSSALAVLVCCGSLQAHAGSLAPLSESPGIRLFPNGSFPDLEYTLTQDLQLSTSNDQGSAFAGPCIVTNDRGTIALRPQLEISVFGDHGSASASTTCRLELDTYFDMNAYGELRYEYFGIGHVDFDPETEIGRYGWSMGGLLTDGAGVEHTFSAVNEFTCNRDLPNHSPFPDCQADWGASPAYHVVEGLPPGQRLHGVLWVNLYAELVKREAVAIPLPGTPALTAAGLLALWIAARRRRPQAQSLSAATP